ncbi:MAG: hypothetical protein IJS12_07175 [Lachnospiraceae bacterium]|nr:hypothetical protein [Lachnospiraceae bacterium]
MNTFGKRIINTAAVTTLILAALTACGPDKEAQVSGREIHKDGSVTATIVREWDESLYSVDGLKNMMDEEIQDYNFDHAGDKIAAGEVKCEEGILTCVIDYATDEDYSGFNSRRFVIESLDEAMASDLVKISVKAVKDQAQTDPETIEKTETLSVLITDETGRVTFPGKVLYISDGVEPVSKKSIEVTENMDGLAYIIYENR